MDETNRFQNGENSNGIPEIKAAIPQENTVSGAENENYDTIIKQLTDMNKGSNIDDTSVKNGEIAPVTEQPNIPTAAVGTAYVQQNAERIPDVFVSKEIQPDTAQVNTQPPVLTAIDVNTFNNARAFDEEMNNADANAQAFNSTQQENPPAAQPNPPLSGNSVPVNGSVPFFGSNYTQPVQQAIPVLTPPQGQPVYPQYQPQAQYAPYYGYPTPQQIPSPVQQMPPQPPVPMGYNPTVMPPAQAPVKKRNIGATVYVTLIFLLMAVFIALLVDFSMQKSNGGLFGSNSSTGSSSSASSDDDGTSSDSQSTPASSTDPDDEYTGIDPDGPTITLESVAENGEYSARAAFKKIDPSVVSVLVYENDKEMKNDYTSEGSGVIISRDGYIVTNSHVILNQKNKNGIQVVLWDENVYTAIVVGFDTRTDIAVLKISAAKLIPASFVDSDLVEIGEDVIAVGNPGGIEFSHSLTRGVISAVNRTVSSDNYVKYIQTDTAINPGNSGGPLTNFYGQVVGINTIKIVDEEYEGMGFAIPSNVVKNIVDDLITKGYVQDRVRLGIKGQAIGLIDAERYGLKGGISIVEFTEDSSFAGTMAQKNDIIAFINDVEIDCFATLYGELEKYKPNDKVKVTLYRPSEAKKIDVTIILLADTGQSQN